MFHLQTETDEANSSGPEKDNLTYEEHVAAHMSADARQKGHDNLTYIYMTAAHQAEDLIYKLVIKFLKMYIF